MKLTSFTLNGKKFFIGSAIPADGKAGQVLSQNKDGKLEWVDPPSSLPKGGTNGQLLAKGGEGDYQGKWLTLYDYPIFPDGAAMHNLFYRGKNIQDKFDDESLFASIADGTFRDLFPGDHFDIEISTSFMENEKVRCMLGGFDPYWMRGETPLNRHHAAVVPMNAFTTTARMNATNSTEGGYLGSDMNTKVLPVYEAALEVVFKNKMIEKNDYLTSAITSTTPSMTGAGINGAATNNAWVMKKLRLMTEPEVYGFVYTSSSSRDIGISMTQFPIFRLNPSLIMCKTGGTEYADESNRISWWLSAVSGSAYFAVVSNGGTGGGQNASNLRGVRPVWLIGG